MFLGTFEHTLDAKNRLMVPAKVRQNLSDQLVVSKGFEGCLELRTASEFARYAERLTSHPTTRQSARVVTRQLLANAADLEMDATGRILLPAALLKEAGIAKDLTVIGVGDRYELWDTKAYAAFKKSTDSTFAALAEGLDDDE